MAPSVETPAPFLQQETPEDREKLRNIDPGVVIGQIVSITAHPDPNMTKVRVTRCDIGNGQTETILCGGVNIEEGAYVPVAKVGTVLPGDFAIGERDIRGVVSRGMICARKELGIDASTEPEKGIWLLPEGAKPYLGVSLRTLL